MAQPRKEGTVKGAPEGSESGLEAGGSPQAVSCPPPHFPHFPPGLVRTDQEWLLGLFAEQSGGHQWWLLYPFTPLDVWGSIQINLVKQFFFNVARTGLKRHVVLFCFLI